MGQTKSKTRDQKKGSKLPDIPPESPLGIMIRNWNDRGPRKGKSKLKMVQYCMVEWPKKPLRPHVFWPVFGSFEGWICQALNIYVNSKEPFSQEESDYAGLWIRTSRPFPASILTLKTDEKFEEKEEGKRVKRKNKKMINGSHWITYHLHILTIQPRRLPLQWSCYLHQHHRCPCLQHQQRQN